MSELKVTSIEELKKYSSGELVELPSFIGGTEFVARLKRPSLLAMIKAGKIPNELLSEANKLFAHGTAGVVSSANVDSTKNLFVLLDVICENTFVEPRYNDLKSAGIELTDEQQLAIFTYTQKGIESLKSFRQQ